MAAIGAQRKHLTSLIDFTLTARKRSFAQRTFDGKVCPEPDLRIGKGCKSVGS